MTKTAVTLGILILATTFMLAGCGPSPEVKENPTKEGVTLVPEIPKDGSEIDNPALQFLCL